MMAYRGQNYVIVLSLNFGSKRDVGSISHYFRFTLREEKSVLLEQKVCRSQSQSACQSAAVLAGKELMVRVVMDWHINVYFTL
jgi:hypothetical protein